MQPDEFIDQINRKQMPAFRELFGTFYRYLVLYALRYVKQQEVSEDVVQEVFIAIWESDKKYNSYHGFRAFLYDAVKNRCLNYLEHQNVEIILNIMMKNLVQLLIYSMYAVMVTICGIIVVLMNLYKHTLKK